MKSSARYTGILPAVTAIMVCLLLSPVNTRAGADAVTQANVSFWPQSYAGIWGAQKDANVRLLRVFREEVLNSTDTGMEITRRLYDNSLELSLLLVMNQELSRQAKAVADELLPAAEERLCSTGRAAITRQTVTDMLALLDAFAAKASPRLQADLGYIAEALCTGAILDALQVTVIE